jgi:hypothetical protein
VQRGQRHESLRPYSRFSRPEPLLFLPSSSSIVLTRLGGHHYRPTTTQRSLVVPGIEPGPLDLWPGTVTTKPQRRSYFLLKKTKLHGLSPRANYTDRATAACRRSDCQPFFADIGCQVVSVTNPYGRILGFLDRSRYFFF